jgi:hypothetical protein
MGPDVFYHELNQPCPYGYFDDGHGICKKISERISVNAISGMISGINSPGGKYSGLYGDIGWTGRRGVDDHL